MCGSIRGEAYMLVWTEVCMWMVNQILGRESPVCYFQQFNAFRDPFLEIACRNFSCRYWVTILSGGNRNLTRLAEGKICQPLGPWEVRSSECKESDQLLSVTDEMAVASESLTSWSKEIDDAGKGLTQTFWNAFILLSLQYVQKCSSSLTHDTSKKKNFMLFVLFTVVYYFLNLKKVTVQCLPSEVYE
jgi:hypothetical protein